MKIYKIGVIGFAHMHITSLVEYFLELPNIEWVACADTIPKVPSISTEPGTRKANLEYVVDKTGIKKVYKDYREMLEKEELDIVIFCPENSRHLEVAEAIAEKKIHMITEKPMAASLSEALKMAKSAWKNNVKLIINWPTTWSASIRKTKELIDAREIGDVWQVKWRNGASMGPLAYGQKITDWEKGMEWWHQEEQGGGALLDYCCYGACLSRWFLDKPAISAYGIKANFTSHYGDAEDNAVILVRFPSAMAILEATWTTVNTGIPYGPIIYGTTGTIVVDYERVYIYKERGKQTPTYTYENLSLPEDRNTLAKEVIHHLKTGDPLHPTLDIPLNLDAMAILDAGIRSAKSGKMELVNDINWCIG
jgi:predicted dehydrogenase